MNRPNITLRQHPYWIPALLSILIAAYLRGGMQMPPKTLFANRWAFELRHLVEPVLPELYNFRDTHLVRQMGDCLHYLVHALCAFGIPLAFAPVLCGLGLALARRNPNGYPKSEKNIRTLGAYTLIAFYLVVNILYKIFQDDGPPPSIRVLQIASDMFGAVVALFAVWACRDR
ncbi:hypothetical protein ACFQUU_28565 [Herbaspirillum sp. GCM10030257]|uniref:hypothetical protein n=1 Tax=Herbaspirillum sp. GCM10030257 TaxID=3273393 RepID=UPI003605B23A